MRMTDISGRNLPHPTPDTATYWEGCRNGKLMIQRCSACGHYQFYPRLLCTECMSAEVESIQASGCGKVVSYTIVRQAISQAYAADVPYVVALIRLDEGPTMMSNVIGCDPEQVEIGMPVEAIFEKWSEEITVPKFRARD
jgi:hypothetical protein